LPCVFLRGRRDGKGGPTYKGRKGRRGGYFRGEGRREGMEREGKGIPSPPQSM